MKLTIVILVLFYLVILQRIFKVWLEFFQQDSNISLQEKQLSWVILITGAVVWPLVIPISYLSLLERKLAQQKKHLESHDGNDQGYYQKEMLPNSLDRVKC